MVAFFPDPSVALGSDGNGAFFAFDGFDFTVFVNGSKFGVAGRPCKRSVCASVLSSNCWLLLLWSDLLGNGSFSGKLDGSLQNPSCRQG